MSAAPEYFPACRRDGLTQLRWPVHRRCWAIVAGLVAGMTALMSGVGTARAADDQAVKIGTLHGQMKYDVESFQVKPGTTVHLTLNNTDEMQHNLLILAPGNNKALEIAQKAWA